MIQVAFGFDRRTRSTAITRGRAADHLRVLQEKLDACCALTCCPNRGPEPWCDIKAKAIFVGGDNRRSVPVDSVWNFNGDNVDDSQLARSGLTELRQSEPNAQVYAMVTGFTIFDDDQKTTANGIYLAGAGILIRDNTRGSPTLPHEIGHQVGWRDPLTGGIHSDDQSNLMYGNSGGPNPDCQWCNSVAKLAK